MFNLEPFGWNDSVVPNALSPLAHVVTPVLDTADEYGWAEEVTDARSGHFSSAIESVRHEVPSIAVERQWYQHEWLHSLLVWIGLAWPYISWLAFHPLLELFFLVKMLAGISCKLRFLRV